jgi:hypothetical protein
MLGSVEQRYTVLKDRFSRRKNPRAKFLRKNYIKIRIFYVLMALTALLFAGLFLEACEIKSNC